MINFKYKTKWSDYAKSFKWPGKTLPVTIAIDDVHPEKGWGLQGDDCMRYLHALNEEFGCKFTLFIPSNYHGNYPLSHSRDWIEWLDSLGYMELAAHGHFHQVFKAGSPGECEFSELDYSQANDRLMQCLSEWDAVGHEPLGWRSPGWLTTNGAATAIGEHFSYVAAHTTHNHGQRFGTRTIYGADPIHQTLAHRYPDGLFFQSHIAGEWNDNNWDLDNYHMMQQRLRELQKRFTVEFKTIWELFNVR